MRSREGSILDVVVIAVIYGGGGGDGGRSDGGGVFHPCVPIVGGKVVSGNFWLVICPAESYVTGFARGKGRIRLLLEKKTQYIL